MLVRAASIVPARSRVGVALHLFADPKPVVGTGTVTRVVGADQMGIHLSRMSAEENARLQDFLLPLIMRGFRSGGRALSGRSRGSSGELAAYA